MPSTNSNRCEKRITTGTRVSGSHGALVPNPNSSVKRRVKERIFGTVIEAIGTNKYKVLFDNGETKLCPSRTLRTERNNAGVPLSEAVSTNSTGRGPPGSSGFTENEPGGQESQNSQEMETTSQNNENNENFEKDENTENEIGAMHTDETGALHDGKFSSFLLIHSFTVHN